MSNNTAELPTLTALELESYKTPKEAAAIKSLSEDTFRRHYPHIIEKLSPRRDGVKLRNLLTARPRTAA
jgi:hypothetical protein